MKKVRRPAQPSKRPYRDSALVYGSFAIVFVIIALGTGANMLVAVPVAAGCFVLATGYSWWRLRQREAAEEQES